MRKVEELLLNLETIGTEVGSLWDAELTGWEINKEAKRVTFQFYDEDGYFETDILFHELIKYV